MADKQFMLQQLAKKIETEANSFLAAINRYRNYEETEEDMAIIFQFIDEEELKGVKRHGT